MISFAEQEVGRGGFNDNDTGAVGIGKGDGSAEYEVGFAHVEDGLEGARTGETEAPGLATRTELPVAADAKVICAGDAMVTPLTAGILATAIANEASGITGRKVVGEIQQMATGTAQSLGIGEQRGAGVAQIGTAFAAHLSLHCIKYSRPTVITDPATTCIAICFSFCGMSVRASHRRSTSNNRNGSGSRSRGC